MCDVVVCNLLCLPVNQTFLQSPSLLFLIYPHSLRGHMTNQHGPKILHLYALHLYYLMMSTFSTGLLIDVMVRVNRIKVITTSISKPSFKVPPYVTWPTNTVRSSYIYMLYIFITSWTHSLTVDVKEIKLIITSMRTFTEHTSLHFTDHVDFSCSF